MVRLYGMLLPFARCPRPPGIWENATRKTIWRTIERTNGTFGAMVEYHPSSPKDRMRIYEFGKKALPGIFVGCELIAERIWQRDILIAEPGRIGNIGCIRYLSSKNQRERSIDNTKKKMSSYSQWKMVQQNCQGETSNSENPLSGGNKL